MTINPDQRYAVDAYVYEKAKMVHTYCAQACIAQAKRKCMYIVRNYHRLLI